MPLLTVATRGSKLALWQAQHVLNLLPRVGLRGKLQIITTRGDHLKDTPLYDFGGKGLFAQEIESALQHQQVDIAVHSMKDMPVQTTHSQLTFVCMLARASACDVLIAAPQHRALLGEVHGEKPLVAADLRRWCGLTIATGSLRRRYLLEQAEAELTVQALRGNVTTRLQYLHAGRYDALILAQAAVQRLDWQDLPHRVLDPTWYVPSCAQGVIGVQSRVDCKYNEALRQLECIPTRQAVLLERAVTKALGGSCALPFGCYVRSDRATYVVDAVVLSPRGKQARAACRIAQDTAPVEVVAEVVQRLRDDGLETVLHELAL